MKQKINMYQILFFTAPFFYGLYYGHIAVFTAVILLFFLWQKLKKQELVLYINSTSVCMAIMFLGYFFSAFCAVDSGMAWLGNLKKLPVFLFFILTMQLSKEERTSLLETIPLSGTVMTLAGIAAYIIPSGKEFFYMADRLSGCFQYANTYALFLLCGIIIKGWAAHLEKKDFVELFILTAGIFLTGSRTVFLLLFLAAVMIMVKNKKLRFIIPVTILVLSVIGIIYVYATGNMQNIGRFLTISFQSSTFQGRLLYFYDAVPMLLHHLAGLGCEGYSYLQTEVQTGLYSVQYVHNGFLQIGLDAGIIPMLAGIFSVFARIFSRRTGGMERALCIYLSLHSLLDFDMEYLFMAMVFILCMNNPDGKKIEIQKLSQAKAVQTGCQVLSVVLGIVCLYFFVPLTAYYYDQYALAAAWYPDYTQAQLHLLSETEDEDRAEKLADHILKKNRQATLAYDAKAMVAYIRDDYISVIDYKKQAIRTDKFSKQEYEEYAMYLLEGIEYYGENGNTKKMQTCIEELEKIPELIDTAKDSISSFGKNIKDQADLELEEEITEAIQYYGEIYG